MAGIFNSLFQYLVDVISATITQLFILLGPGILLALIMYFVSDFARRLASGILGDYFFIYFTAIGTIIHELGHAIFAILFGHKIRNLNLFNPQRLGDTIILGSVQTSYNPKSAYQTIGNFFIGIGPIILGSLVIYFTAKFTIGNAVFQPLGDIQISTGVFNSFQNAQGFILDVFTHAIQVLGKLFNAQNLGNIWFYVFMYVVFAVGMHIKISPQDLKGAWQGFLAMIVLFLVFNLLTVWMGDFTEKTITLISRSFSFFYATMLFAIILIIFFIIVLLMISFLKNVLRNKSRI